MSVRLFFFQAEDGIRDLVRSRGLGDVYKRQRMLWPYARVIQTGADAVRFSDLPVVVLQNIGAVAMQHTSAATLQ